MRGRRSPAGHPLALLALLAGLGGLAVCPGVTRAQVAQAAGDATVSPPEARTGPATPPPAADDPDRAARRAARDLRNRRVAAEWDLHIDAPGHLRSLLERYLDVSRFRNADADDTISVVELSRMVAAAPEQARSLLQTEGYFNADVQAAMEMPQNGRPIVRLVVKPGPHATVGRLTLEVQGTLAERADSGDAAAQGLLDAVRRDWSLPEGRAFSGDAWADAKSSLLTRLRAGAYPSANWIGTAAQVDPATQQVRIFAVADSGPRYRFGALDIEGLERYEAPAVRNLAPFTEGQPYNEKDLLDFQERLAGAGLFDSVSVTIEADPERAEAVPVLVRLREQQAQQATVGVGISADSGPRVSLEHVHRRPFGQNWIAKSKIELARDDRSLSIDLTSHPKARAYRNLLSGLVSREEAAGLIVKETQARFGRTQDTERIERLYYLELQNASTESPISKRSVGAVTGNYEWVWRDLDSNLMPTRGLSASARVGGGRSFGVSGYEDQHAGWFTRANGRVTAYLPLGEHWYTTSRLELGQVFAADSIAVPYPLLFRAGGDHSVRGYNYQALGPDDEDGISVGGRVLGTASVEIARPFSLNRPEFLWAVFADAGDAALSWKGFSPALGVGVGLRWRSPVGPLSLDLAYGREVERFRVHFNVGIAF